MFGMTQPSHAAGSRRRVGNATTSVDGNGLIRAMLIRPSIQPRESALSIISSLLQFHDADSIRCHVSKRPWPCAFREEVARCVECARREAPRYCSPIISGSGTSLATFDDIVVALDVSARAFQINPLPGTNHDQRRLRKAGNTPNEKRSATCSWPATSQTSCNSFGGEPGWSPFRSLVNPIHERASGYCAHSRTSVQQHHCSVCGCVAGP